MGTGNRFGTMAAVLICTVMLAGCGGDQDRDLFSWFGNRTPPRSSDPTPEPAPEPEPEPEPAPTPTNTPPRLSGSPARSIIVGSPYRFTPRASDADGDSLVFRIENRPTWARFSSSTGALTGTPQAADVGTYTNIVISVSDGHASARLAPFSITVETIGNGSATLTWTAPTERTDGSPLTNLSGYRVYWGSESRNYTESAEINSPGVTTYVVDNLGRGTHYFVTTAVSSDGLESEPSNEASKTIQ